MTMTEFFSNRNVKLGLMLLGLTVLIFFVTSGYAVEQKTLGETAKFVTGSFEAVVKLIVAAAYIAGLGFAVGAVMKFKQHKDNPTQIPIGTPIALLFVAAALIFLPTLIGVTQATIFEGGATAGGATGSGAELIPGGKAGQ